MSQQAVGFPNETDQGPGAAHRRFRREREWEDRPALLVLWGRPGTKVPQGERLLLDSGRHWRGEPVASELPRHARFGAGAPDQSLRGNVLRLHRQDEGWEREGSR